MQLIGKQEPSPYGWGSSHPNVAGLCDTEKT